MERCYRHQETDRPAVYTRTGYASDDPTYDTLRAYMEEHTERKAGWSSWQHVELPTTETTTTETSTKE